MNLADERYLNLATFRRNGTGVNTPVWVVGLDRRLYIFTDGTSAKVKRLRRDSRVRVAPCDMRGKVQGDWIDGTGRIIDDESLEKRVYEELQRKYGWQMQLVNFGSWLGGRIDRRAIIEITL